MRARGAKVTDVVVLVVAADDGIMPQTVEAISHAKAANVPIIVAINKIDKPDADINRVTAELLSHELVPESMGGDVIVVPVSAKQRTNLDKLLESVILQSEVLDLKANPNRRAKGIVVESRLEKGKGSVSTLLVQNGTLSLGDIIVTSSSFGKIKYMNNDQGEKISKALPSMPVEVLGLNEAPLAGEVFDVVSSEKEAKDVYEYRQRKLKEERSAKVNKTTLEDLFAKSSGSSRVKELNIIIKGDVQGSIEAIAGSLEKLISDEVKIRILHKAVGGITESDVTLANASNALILGFNVRANSQAKTSSEKCSIDIRYYSIIYDLIDDVKRIMSGMLQPIMREKYIGMLEIRKVFNVTKFGKIAGCYVTDGVVKRGAKVRLLRDNIVIHEGALKTLRRFKDDVKEVKSGYECGAAFENYEDIKEGDKVEASEIIEEKRAL
jgi:translation initiation factor IF-2